MNNPDHSNLSLILAFSFGTLFVATLLAIAVFIRNPTPFLYTVSRVILALAGAGVATVIPGLLNVTVSTVVKASGALAVFAIIYFFPVAGVTGVVQSVELKRKKVLEIAAKVAREEALTDDDRNYLQSEISPDFQAQFWQLAAQNRDKNAFLASIGELASRIS